MWMVQWMVETNRYALTKKWNAVDKEKAQCTSFLYTYWEKMTQWNH